MCKPIVTDAVIPRPSAPFPLSFGNILFRLSIIPLLPRPGPSTAIEPRTRIRISRQAGRSCSRISAPRVEAVRALLAERSLECRAACNSGFSSTSSTFRIPRQLRALWIASSYAKRRSDTHTTFLNDRSSAVRCAAVAYCRLNPHFASVEHTKRFRLLLASQSASAVRTLPRRAIVRECCGEHQRLTPYFCLRSIALSQCNVTEAVLSPKSHKSHTPALAQRSFLRAVARNIGFGCTGIVLQ